MQLGPRKTIEDRLGEFGALVRARLEPDFRAAGVRWPPQRARIVAFKAERRIDLFVTDALGRWRRVKTYPVIAASGVLGPKLREGDEQVPEGHYPIESLNPNSKFHVALRIGYPNEFDRARAREDGRAQLGGDIMIHGGDRSVGCLALGDRAAEELFVVAALTGIANTDVILAPSDLRCAIGAMVPDSAPPWTSALWDEIRRELGATES